MDEPVVVGKVLLGKYRVERVLGRGGMGIVVAVRHIDLGQLHAMKFLLPTALEHDESLARFLREARAAACLSSEHVAKVQDVGRMENGAPYMVMEYLDGCDLKALVSREGPLSVELAIAYLLQVCEAIGEAHAAGIVHRDLKPSNLFLVRRRTGSACIKVLDFGISKQLDPHAVDLTNTDAALGSPLYMSPEQMSQSKTVDARTDIWALGVILYELLSGTSPFRGGSIYEVTARVLQNEPTPLHALRGGISLELEGVIARCLRKRREERFQSIDELQAALVKFAPPEVFVRPSMPSLTNPHLVVESVTGGGATTITFGRTGKPILLKKPRPLLWAGLGASLALVVAGIGVLWWMHQMPADVAPSVSASPAAPIPPAAVSLQGSPEMPQAASTVTVTQNNVVEPPPSAKRLDNTKPVVVKPAPKSTTAGALPRRPTPF